LEKITDEETGFFFQWKYTKLYNGLYIVPELPLFEENRYDDPAHLHTIKTLSAVVKLYFHPLRIILKD
jgi:hypothetical protein